MCYCLGLLAFSSSHETAKCPDGAPIYFSVPE
jgi:hypothetical protein